MKNNFDIINNTEFDVTFYTDSWHKILNTITDMLNIDDALELSLNIISKEMSLKLNQTYRQKNYVADVLSFPVEADNQKLYAMINMRILGDIFICFELAQEQADKYEHSLLRELSFLFLHGLLHLLGYDHQTKSEEDIMFALQDAVLTKLEINRGEIMEKDYLKILKELSNNSYSPYSKFQVAAILQIKDDIIIKGVNIENIAYGETICAERVALMQAYTQGFTKEDLIAIHLYTKTGITPCGSCCQVMSELLTANCQIYIYNRLGT